jgi:oligopeptide transport system ATP-binding protein
MPENNVSARLEIKNLSVSFSTPHGKSPAVRDVSFSVAPGETLAVVGESGSGKTVTCRAITRLLAKNASIDGGEILLDGDDLLKETARGMVKRRGRDVAMIFQDPMTSLDPTMKIGRQILESVLLHTNLRGDSAKKRVVELLELVGIENPRVRRNQYPHEFSGGQRQRIVIAIMLACNPKVLIADEPTTALDVTMQAQIIDLFKDLQQQFSTSIIFITHDLGVVANIADRTAVMYAGKIVEIGTTREVFYDPRHPYTWGLLNSMPTLDTAAEKLTFIPGTTPALFELPQGDAFAPRNEYALFVDTVYAPPLFKITDTHFAASWLLDPRAPHVEVPKIIAERRKAYWTGASYDGAGL